MIRRREFLAAGAAFAVAPRAFAAVAFDPRPDRWRSYAVTTKIEIRNPGAGACHAWIPLPQQSGFAFQRFDTNTWDGNAARIQTEHDSHYGADYLHVVWAEGEKAPVFSVTSNFATQDRFVDLSKPGKSTDRLTTAERNLYLSSTKLLPTGGVVGAVSDNITRGARTDLAKVRAIYDWVVENSYRDPNTRGCGSGDIMEMLRTDNFGGKCADLNGLFVALVRAAGVPARDVYGIRVVPSRFGFKALGASSTNITKAQHCRSEVFLDSYGWVAMDPADVRKVMLEEQQGGVGSADNTKDGRLRGLPAVDEKVVAARKTLFGAWEGNWLAYNTAHDLRLPGSKSAEANGFLMYPEVEVGGERRDCLLPDTVSYTITAAERTA
ncbi:transglutaminase-like domain-containing protein [Roseiterribacter gracilis]|uniref:Transglutaminase n=1 Tax=Roseiterribacter gracilis TaxID=2812848 RepID=A0A8S8XD35_9PROT|nr:transglutaminase [Rhodospirillales bacterium TMPK1]